MDMDNRSSEDEYLIALRSELEQSSAIQIENRLLELDEADARHAFFRLGDDEQDRLLTLIDGVSAERLLAGLPELKIALLLERVKPETAAKILEAFTTAEQAHILEEIAPPDAAPIVDELETETAREINELVAFDENTAGWLMDPTPVSFRRNQSVGDVLKLVIEDESALDSASGQHPYVVSKTDKLIGVLSLRSLLLAKRSAQLSDILTSPLTVTPDTSLEDLRDIFDDHDYLGVPVVDEHYRLIGAVSKEAFMDAWRTHLQRNAQSARGVVGDELRSMPLLFRSRRRLSWLSANIVLNIIAASVIASFEETLTAVIALAIFLPMVSDMSGCSGNQAVAVSMREISLGLARPSDALRVWWKEASVGLINGTALGIIIGFVVWMWKGDPVLAVVIGLALSINTLIAVSIGGVVPLVLKRFRVDPAVASGPLLTTITDMAGFFLVLGFATLALPWIAV